MAQESRGSAVVGLQAGLLLWGLFVGAAAALRVWGRSTAYRDLVLLAAANIIAIPVISMNALWIANAALDRSTAVSRTATVIDRARPSGDKPPQPILTVESWRGQREGVKFRASDQLFLDREPYRTKLTFDTKPGVFGYDWLANEPTIAWSAPKERRP